MPKRILKRDLPAHATEVRARLAEEYPGATCALRHENPLQLLVATILSAQCTDVRVNQVTRTLFEKYPTAEAYADASQEELEEDGALDGGRRTGLQGDEKECEGHDPHGLLLVCVWVRCSSMLRSGLRIQGNGIDSGS